VVSIEWLDPIMLGGTWMPELIELAGGVDVGARAGESASTPGPRLVESLEVRAACLRPRVFPDFATKHRSVILGTRRADMRAREGRI
jgi:iron complex transport system substrate-binding protein